MEIRYHKWSALYKGDHTTRTLFCRFNIKETAHTLSLQLPGHNYDLDWTLIPTVTCKKDRSITPGPNFHIEMKWLRLTILRFQWMTGPKDDDMYPF